MRADRRSKCTVSCVVYCEVVRVCGLGGYGFLCGWVLDLLLELLCVMTVGA